MAKVIIWVSPSVGELLGLGYSILDLGELGAVILARNSIHVEQRIISGAPQLLIIGQKGDEAEELVSRMKRKNPELAVWWFSINLRSEDREIELRPGPQSVENFQGLIQAVTGFLEKNKEK